MIVHVFNSTIVSGPETLVIPALRGLDRDVAVVFLSETRRMDEARRPVEYARKLGLTTVEVPVRSQLDPGAVARLARVFEELRPSVVHSHDVKASAYSLRAAGRADGGRLRRSMKLVSTHHGVRGRSGPRARFYESVYTRFVLPRFDKVLAVCSSDRELLVGRGLDPARVETHPNGVDRPRVGHSERAARRSAIRSEWGLPGRGISDDDVVVGFVGRIAPEKRIDRILEVCSHLSSMEDLPAWHLVLFGTGPLEYELKARTRRMGLEDHVHWMGYRQGLGAELAGFDVLISMSDAEGLPINLVEAGWGATPVFATAVDGNLDLIPDESFGTLVPVGEGEERIAGKLAELIRDENRRMKTGEAFQARVTAEFSGSRWLKRLEEVYSN